MNRVELGFIKRIRGIAYSTRVSPQISNRMVTSARSLLNHFVPDVFVYTDHYKGDESGKSPGFGVCLMAETTNKIIIMSEKMAEGGVLPEDLGLECAKLLCEEISKKGCVDTSCQSILLLLMVLPQKVLPTPGGVQRVATKIQRVPCALPETFGKAYQAYFTFRTKQCIIVHPLPSI